MKKLSASLIGIAMLGAAGTAAAASGPTVYTWTDASGTTHFSDKPPAQGASERLTLPALPPPDRTAEAANAAWLVQLNKDTQKMLDREAALRRAEAQAAARAAVVQPYPEYYPVYLGGSPFYSHRFRRRRRFPGKNYDRDDFGMPHRAIAPVTDFPQQRLPSSFPNPPMPSFVGGLPRSFPEQPAPSMPPRR